MRKIKMIVPIKQVPETANVKMDPVTGTMVRDGVESIVNPLDLYAIETALRIKDADARARHVTAVTMGPVDAIRCVREAIAMGCDDGVLLSAREFAGSDTWATSKILSEACKLLGDYDIIITGERATDGDTAQVGPEISSFLDIPIATYVYKIIDIKDDRIVVKRLVEGGYEVLSLSLPCLLTVVKDIAIPRLPRLSGKQKARKISIPRWTLEDITALQASEIGLSGSPTRVVKIEMPKVARHGEIVFVNNEIGVEAAVAKLLSFLKNKNLIQKGGPTYELWGSMGSWRNL